jgi:hypothetical protein
MPTVSVFGVWLLAEGVKEFNGRQPVSFKVMISGRSNNLVVKNLVFRDCGADRAKAVGLFEHLSELLDDGDVYGFTAKLTTDGEWVAVL